MRSRFYAAYRSARFAARFGMVRIDVVRICVTIREKKDEH